MGRNKSEPLSQTLQKTARAASEEILRHDIEQLGIVLPPADMDALVAEALDSGDAIPFVCNRQGIPCELGDTIVRIKLRMEVRALVESYDWGSIKTDSELFDQCVEYAMTMGDPVQYVKDWQKGRTESPVDVPSEQFVLPTHDVTITVPLSEIIGAPYLPMKLEVGRLTMPQREALVSMRIALKEKHVQTANGKHVDSNPDAIRWLLEQIAEGK